MTAPKVTKPSLKNTPDSNVNLTGVRGSNANTQVVQGDGKTKPIISFNSKGDIYTCAHGVRQTLCNEYKQSVSGSITEYLKDVDKKITGTLTTHAQGPVTFTTNSCKTESIVGTYLQKVIGNQDVTISGDQTIDVKSNLETIVGEQITETVGLWKREATAPTTVKCNSSWTNKIDSDFWVSKGATEVSLTFSEKFSVGAAVEASAVLGAAFKVVVAKTNENVLGLKRVLAMGASYTVTMGVESDFSPLSSLENSAEVEAASIFKKAQAVSFNQVKKTLLKNALSLI